MKNKIILIGLVIILIVGGAWFYLKPQTEPVTTQPIKIGVVLSFTGDAAADSENMKRGIELAKADLAKKGVKVEISYENDETNPAKTVLAVQKLLINKPQAIIGPAWSFLGEAAVPVLDRAKVPSYEPGNTSEFVTTKSPYLFFGGIKNSEKEKTLTDWLKTNKRQRVAIIVSNDAWGNSHFLPYQKAAEAAGVEVVLVEKLSFGQDGGSMPLVLAKVKAAKADVIVWTGYDAGATALIKRSQELKLNIPIVGTLGLVNVVSNKLVSLTPTDQIYVFYTNTNKEFENKFKKEYGVIPGTYADNAYDGLMVLVEAISKTDGQNDSVANYLKTKTNYQGFAKDYRFDLNGDIKGGQWLLERLK